MRRYMPVLRKGLAIVPAVALMGLAIGLATYTNLGLDVFASFLSGAAQHLHVALGTALFGFNALVLLIYLFVARSLFGIGTVLAGLGLGPCVNGFIRLLGAVLPASLPFWGVLAIRVLATVFTAAALAWYIQADGGVQPMDMILLTISRRLKKSYGTSVYIWNTLLLVGALLLGGPLGIGTLISLLCTGKLIDWFMPLFRPAVRYCAGIAADPSGPA